MAFMKPDKVISDSMPDAPRPYRVEEKQLRQQLLEAPVDFLPIPEPDRRKLAAMGFATVREAFRAALVGRLAYRKKAPGKLLEMEVLEACCALLGYQLSALLALRSYRPRPGETVGQALARLNGGPFLLAPALLATSIREMFLPSAIHEVLVEHRVQAVQDLLALPLKTIRKTGGFGPRTLGNLLALIFDFLFLVHEPEAGLPPMPLPERDREEGLPGLGLRLLLTPWFDESTLRQGAELLSRGRLRHPLFFGEEAGALILDGRLGRVHLRFAHSTQRSHGFTITDCECELCGSERRRGRCCHGAALALHFLHGHPSRPAARLPLPLSFGDSPWQPIGQILFDLYGPGNQGDIAVRREGRAWRLTMTSKAVQSWLSWLLPPDILQEGIALFGEKFTVPEPLPPDETAKQLLLLFRRLTRAEGGAAGEEEDDAQRSSRKEREESIWFWLARSLHAAIPPGHLHILRPEGEPLFALTARHPETGGELLNFTLPRAKTPEVVDGLAKYGAGLPVAEAQAFSLVEFDRAEATLVITPSLRLADGRILPRTDLEANRYGRYYYLPEEGFLSVREQAPDEALGSSIREATRIPANAAPAFLERHRRALNHRHNQVDRSLRALSVQEGPDRLALSSCRMEDDWCYLSGHYGMGSEDISFSELLRARQRGLDHFPGRSRWLKLKGTPLDWLYELGEERLWQQAEGRQEGIRLTRKELLMLSALAPQLKLEVAENERVPLRRLLEIDRWTDQHHLPVIPAHLRDYQRNGLAWLYALYRNRLGGVLADDMGLGKTHQALGLLKAIRVQDNGHRFLVVCPATVVAHWVEKIGRFYPEFRPFVYHGSNRDLEQAGSRQLILTTYGIIRRDADKLARLRFEVVIFDEIQHIKNKKTDAYAAASLLNGRMVIGLTGTPLENSVADLKSIFDICLPGLLGSDAAFRKNYAEPIEEANDRPKRETLHRLLGPFLLRRTRTQVLTELPKVIEDVRTCALSEDQVKLYREVIAGQGRLLLKRLADDRERKLPYLEVLAVINYLKQICDHPSLVQGDTDWRRYASGKWDLFVELLEECLAGSMKVVVYSHYTRMLDIIGQYLTATEIPFCGLRGSMPLRTRERNIRRFNTDPSCRVFCASLLAGGVGVDLTAAQAVIHYDRWWNAAREDQATARVHRMGQKQVVQAFKLVTVGTLEEKINRLIEKKRHLAQHLVREDDASVIKRLSRQELIELLEWNLHTTGSNDDHSRVRTGTAGGR